MIGETFNRQVYVDLRPLDKGIDRETPSHFLPKGFFIDLKNTHLKPGGLFRRGGYCSMNRGSLPSLDRKVYGSPVYFGEFGEAEALLVTKKHLWRIEEDGVSERYVLLNELIQDNLMATVERIDGLFYGFAVLQEPVPFGDYEYSPVRPFAGDTVWFGEEPYEISNVANETITIEGQDFNGFLVAFRDHIGNFEEKTYFGVRFYKAFRRTPDWTVYSNNFVFTDNSQRGLQVYQGKGQGQLSVTKEFNPEQDPELLEIDTVTYFANRLWIAALTEDARDERFRIRWSTLIIDPTVTPTFNVSDFIDLTIGRSAIRRLFPLGNLIVAYLGDRIFYGRPTNIVGLPYDFTPLDTGNVGLVGPRAITNWLDAHWFVGQDNIYSLSATRALEPIGTLVMKDTIQNRDYDLEKTIVTADPINERIVFQFFERSSQVVRDIWSYYYKTQGWAIEQGPFRDGDFTVRGFFFGKTISTLTWEDLEDILWEDPDLFRPWISYEPVDSPEKNFILKNDGEIYLYTEGGKYDSYFQGPPPPVLATTPEVVISDSIVLSDLFGTKIERNIPVVIESGDIDFGTPNVLKTITQMSAKMEKAVGFDVTFDVRVSSNRGERKKNVGQLRIKAGNDEGKVDFRMSGSLFRFELVSASRAEPWILSEVVFLAQEIGRETKFV